MVVTNDPALADRCRSLRNLCFQPKQRFVHDELGWNYRMTNLQAALGLAQLERLPAAIEIKKRMGAHYESLIQGFTSLDKAMTRQCAQTAYAQNIYWVYGLFLNESLPFDRQLICGELQAVGVGTRPFFWPIHLQPVFINSGLFEAVSLPVSEKLAKQGFYLPSGLTLKANDQEAVINHLHSIISRAMQDSDQ